MIQNIILVGGRGSRYSEVTKETPKPLIKINGKPLVEHILNIYEKNFDHNKFILATGYKHDIFDEYVYKKDSKEITLKNTGLNTETGGRVYKIAKNIEDEIFCVTYGDGLADINLQKLVKQHV